MYQFVRKIIKPIYRSIIETVWSCLYLGKIFNAQWTTLKRSYWYRYWAIRLNRIGKATKIYGPITILNPEKVSIGDEVTLNHGVMIVAKTENITIGDRVRISAGTKIIGTGLNTETSNGSNRQHESLPITIEDDCWIGANAVITAGVQIGARSVIAAGSVVNKSVKADTVVGGVPAKVIKTLNKND